MRVIRPKEVDVSRAIGEKDEIINRAAKEAVWIARVAGAISPILSGKITGVRCAEGVRRPGLGLQGLVHIKISAHRSGDGRPVRRKRIQQTVGAVRILIRYIGPGDDDFSMAVDRDSWATGTNGGGRGCNRRQVNGRVREGTVRGLDDPDGILAPNDIHSAPGIEGEPWRVIQRQARRTHRSGDCRGDEAIHR